MTGKQSIAQITFYALTGAIIMLLSGCGGRVAALPGIYFGSDDGGRTYGFDTLPFEIRRADGTVLIGHATVRLLRVDFYTRDAKRLIVCSGGFTLDREHASVPMSVDCTSDGILHGTVTSAWSDRGAGTFMERSGRTSTFRYGALALPAPSVEPKDDVSFLR